MVQFEEIIKVKFFKHFYNINANILDIKQALSCASRDLKVNYECLENIGDSVLKIITSIYLYFTFEKE